MLRGRDAGTERATGVLMAPTDAMIIRPRQRAVTGALPSWARAYLCTAVVLLIGIVVRAGLIPRTHGQDFTVWDLASRATLAGSNIYAHHPHYPGGPYTYFPLFLYIELPFRWLALHTNISFIVLGKLPIMAGDVLAAVLIAAVLRRRGHSDAFMALGTALYFLNPLVLYNGAYYGRFDPIPVGLFLLALYTYAHTQTYSGQTVQRGRWAFALLYAMAVAAKTYPIFIVLWLLRHARGQRLRIIVALVVVVGGVSLPYLISSPRPFIKDIVIYNSTKLPTNLSWQVVLLHVMSPHNAKLLSYAFLALFVVAVALASYLDLLTYCSVAIILFLLFSKLVIEQYFTWPMPFLIIAALSRRSWLSGALFVALTVTGSIINPDIHPFGTRPLGIIVAAAVCMLLYVIGQIYVSLQPRGTDHNAI